jgi:hypothetical protein
MPPDGTLINGSVSGKMDRYLHPEGRVGDWQAGPAIVSDGAVGKVVAASRMSSAGYEIRLTFTRKIPNIDHIDYVYGSTASRMRRIGRPACVRLA